MYAFCAIVKNREPLMKNKSGAENWNRENGGLHTILYCIVLCARFLCVQNEQIFNFMKFPMFMAHTERAFDKNVLLVFMVLINGMFWRS